MAAPEKVSQGAPAPQAEPSRASLVRANKALQFYVFKGGRSEHGDAELVVARAIDAAIAETRLKESTS